MIGDWTKVSELRVRTPVIYAIGTMMAVCSDSNRVTLLPKVLPVMTNGLKREKPRDMLLPAKGYAAMLSFASDTVGQSLVPQMDALLTLLLQSLVPLLADREADSPGVVKSTIGALLQAVENAAEFFMDGLITYVSKLLDAKSNVKDPGMRAAAVTILRHIISRKSLEKRLQPFCDYIIATIKLAMQDLDWRVRRAVASTVIAMGASATNFFKAVGGTDLINYVIRNASVPDNIINEFNEAAKKKDPGLGTSPEELRDTCRNTLALFCASGKLDDCLWPFLLEHMSEHVTSPHLLNSFPTICRCLVQLGSRVSQGDSYYVDFSVNVNVPKPGHLAAKFLVQAMQLSHYTAEELHSILEAMMTIAPLIDDPFAQHHAAEATTPVGNLWLGNVPELQELLMKGEAQSQDDWEELMSKLVSKTMTSKQSEAWVEEVTAACLQQLPAYHGIPTMFRSALLVIGIGISRCTKRDFVHSTVETIADVANHDNKDHEIGLAKGFGYIAGLHPDLSLEKLGSLAKGPEKKGFFASKDKTKKELVENSRAIAALGLCYSARRMQSAIVTSRIDASVVPNLISILAETKTVEVKLAVCEGCVLLEQPLKKQTSFVFKMRDSLIEALLRSVPIDPATKIPSTKPLAMQMAAVLRGVTALTNGCAQPPLAASVTDKILTTVLQFITRGWTDLDADAERLTQVACSEALNAAFMSNPKLELDAMLASLLAQSVSPRDVERLRALLLITKLVEKCSFRMEQLLVESQPVVSSNITVGTLIGRLVPRMMDSSADIRRIACDALLATLRVIAMLHADMVQEQGVDVDQIVAEVQGIKQRVASLARDGTQASEKEVGAITKLVCMQIVAALPDQKHFSSLLDTLLVAGITDPQDDAASCSCVVMHGMIRGLGGQLPEAAAKRCLENLVDAVSKVGTREQSLSGILVSIRNLAKHHSLLVYNGLLRYETPHTPAVIKAISAVCGDSALAEMFLNHCLDTVLNSQLVEDIPDPKDPKKLVRDMAMLPLAAACSIGWICQTAKGAEAASAQRGAVYCTLLLYLTAAHTQGSTAKATLVAQSLQHAVSSTAAEVTTDRMERYGFWPLLRDGAKFHIAVSEITKYFCREEHGDTNDSDRNAVVDPIDGLVLAPAEPTALAIELAQFILPYANKPQRSHRRTAVLLCAMLLRYSLGEKRLLQSLVTALLSRSGADEDALVRSEVLIGFKNLTVHDYSASMAYISPVLSAILSNVGDSSPLVAVAALQSLLHLVKTVTDKSQVAPVVVNIILKLKGLFEVADSTQRGLSFQVLGLLVEIANAGGDAMDDQTIEQQVHLHLVTLLVHVEDEDAGVRTQAKAALQQFRIFLCAHASQEAASRKLADLFDKSHMQPIAKTNFDEFANDFCFTWVTFFPGRVNDVLVSCMGFFVSERDPLRAAAVSLCGFVLKHLPAADMGRANVDQVCNALIQMMNPAREKCGGVRAKAARAIGIMREL